MNLRGLTDDFKTMDSPQYGLTDKRFYISIFIASVLMIATILGMVLLADTVVAEAILWLYNVFWFLGVVVISVVLGIGWYVGLKGINEDSMGLAAFGVLLSVLAYSGFGGAILSRFDSSVWGVALGITGLITIGITIVLSAYIFSGVRDLSQWITYSGGCFLVALVLALVGSFFPPIQILVILLVLLGFIFELGFEIWYCSRGGRSPLANGFAIYFAFAGVFVHILQFVLEAVAQE